MIDKKLVSKYLSIKVACLSIVSSSMLTIANSAASSPAACGFYTKAGELVLSVSITANGSIEMQKSSCKQQLRMTSYGTKLPSNACNSSSRLIGKYSWGGILHLAEYERNALYSTSNSSWHCYSRGGGQCNWSYSYGSSSCVLSYS
jgi:hypothetical protein